MIGAKHGLAKLECLLQRLGRLVVLTVLPVGVTQVAHSIDGVGMLTPKFGFLEFKRIL